MYVRCLIQSAWPYIYKKRYSITVVVSNHFQRCSLTRSSKQRSPCHLIWLFWRWRWIQWPTWEAKLTPEPSAKPLPHPPPPLTRFRYRQRAALQVERNPILIANWTQRRKIPEILSLRTTSGFPSNYSNHYSESSQQKPFVDKNLPPDPKRDEFVKTSSVETAGRKVQLEVICRRLFRRLPSSSSKTANW